MKMLAPDKYEVVTEIDGLKYEIVKLSRAGLFGETIFQACTSGIEMVPKTVRRTLGTFNSRSDAEARLRQEIGAFGEKVPQAFIDAKKERDDGWPDEH